MAEETPDNNADAIDAQAPGQIEAVGVTERVIPDEAVVDAIIRKRVYAAVGIGLVPVPLVDFLGLTALQLELIHALSKAYGVEFKRERVKSIISSLLGGALTTASVPLAASLLKSIPVIGTTAGTATISIVGGASTYALGWAFDRHFRTGGTLANFDTQEAKAYFKTKLEEGKTFVGKVKNKIRKGAPDGTAAARTEEPAATTA